MNYVNDVENSVIEKYFYIVYRLLKSQNNEDAIRLSLNKLKSNLIQMTILSLKTG